MTWLKSMPRRAEATDHYAVPTVSEAQLRARVVELAHAAGWRVFSLPIAKTRRPVKDAVGYPDLTLARHGEVIWMELKTDKGTASKVQLDWIMALGAGRCWIIRPEDLTNGRLGMVLAQRHYGSLG